jgi:hypothetical protein
MCQSWQYLGFNVFLDVGPRLAILRRSIWEELLEISRFDAGEDAAIFYCIIVIDDYAR